MKIFFIAFLLVATSFAEDESALQEFIRANNLFAATVYKEYIQNNNENVLVSPYSAEAVLMFAQSGCKGNTAQELRNALHLPEDENKIEAGAKASLPLLSGNHLYTLNVANKMYVKNNFSINEGFSKTAEDIYGADIESIDFAKTVEAADTINNWVEKKTNDKIKNLVDPLSLNERTKVLLINALYFKANWSDQFSKLSTRPKKFYKTADDVIEVDMMQRFGNWYNYYVSTELDATFLELPFQGGEASMVIVLPNEKEGLKTLEDQVDKVFLPQNFESEFLNVIIPKFKIESTIDFVKILKNLGVMSAFNGTSADLSGIAGKPGQLIISKILQKTFIDVLEGGVEAASSTYVEIPRPPSPQPPTPVPKNFIADHPFIFYLKVKNFIIFAGRVLVPRQ